jgi:hypothetical protein
MRRSNNLDRRVRGVDIDETQGRLKGNSAADPRVGQTILTVVSEE